MTTLFAALTLPSQEQLDSIQSRLSQTTMKYIVTYQDNDWKILHSFKLPYHSSWSKYVDLIKQLNVNQQKKKELIDILNKVALVLYLRNTFMDHNSLYHIEHP